MNVGEMGNFISYAFAPASVVAPLGTVSCIYQPCTYVSTPESQILVRSHCQLLLCTLLAWRTLSQGMIGPSLKKKRSQEVTIPQIDLLGILIAIIGAVTVVLASNASDSRLGPDELLTAVSQTSFIVYSSMYVAGAILLATLSEGSIGRTWVFVDIGLCALFGLFCHCITFNC